MSTEGAGSSPEGALAALVSRALRAEVAGVSGERLPDEAGVERERIRFTQDGEPRSLVIERYPPEAALEAQLLPFLSRKTDRVPVVHARGIPRSAVAARPWALVEDLVDARDACDDLVAIEDAKRAIERAVAADAPALRALGVGGDGAVLVHGDLRCANAKQTARGIVIVRWSKAHLGAAGETART